MENVELNLDRGNSSGDLNDSSRKLHQELEIPFQIPEDSDPNLPGILLPDIECTLTEEKNRIDFECEMKGWKLDTEGFEVLVGGTEQIKDPDLKRDPNQEEAGEIAKILERQPNKKLEEGGQIYCDQSQIYLKETNKGIDGTPFGKGR